MAMRPRTLRTSWYAFLAAVRASGFPPDPKEKTMRYKTLLPMAAVVALGLFRSGEATADRVAVVVRLRVPLNACRTHPDA